jgi:predicted DsbA family dithiol-disulfide isomerase
VVWRHFPLHPDIPEREGGVTLAELFGARMAYIEPMRQRLRQAMVEEGLPYGDPERTFNSRRAQELGAWAEAEHGVALHDALFRACFVEGRDLGSREELLAIAEAAGLDAAAARRALDDRSYRAEVDADWQRARELGITGVPTFVVGNRGVVGAQPYPALERFLEACGARRRGAG